MEDDNYHFFVKLVVWDWWIDFRRKYDLVGVLAGSWLWQMICVSSLSVVHKQRRQIPINFSSVWYLWSVCIIWSFKFVLVPHAVCCSQVWFHCVDQGTLCTIVCKWFSLSVYTFGVGECTTRFTLPVFKIASRFTRLYKISVYTSNTVR